MLIIHLPIILNAHVCVHLSLLLPPPKKNSLYERAYSDCLTHLCMPPSAFYMVALSSVGGIY